MKYLTLLLTAISFSFITPAYAQSMEAEPMAQAEHAIASGDIHVSVNGLVCDFCARALEKVFGKEEAVEDIGVNLHTKIITINFNEGQTLDDKRITKLINDAGYNVENIHRVE